MVNSSQLVNCSAMANMSSSPSLDIAVAGIDLSSDVSRKFLTPLRTKCKSVMILRFTLAKISIESEVPVNSDMIPFKVLLFGGQNGIMDWLASRTK